MKTDERHASKVALAHCDLCQVEYCEDCDVVHVHVGSMSLRLTMAAFMATCATFLEAARTVSAQSKTLGVGPLPPRAGLQ